jgi:hypothetical protein
MAGDDLLDAPTGTAVAQRSEAGQGILGAKEGKGMSVWSAMVLAVLSSRMSAGGCSLAGRRDLPNLAITAICIVHTSRYVSLGWLFISDSKSDFEFEIEAFLYGHMSVRAKKITSGSTFCPKNTIDFGFLDRRRHSHACGITTFQTNRFFLNYGMFFHVSASTLLDLPAQVGILFHLPR